MHLLKRDDDKVLLHHEGHTFQASLLEHSTVDSPGPDLLATPQLHCVDEGCDYTCRTFFPIHGDAEAQRMHAHYRHAIGRHKTMKLAAQAVRDAVREAGGEPRISPSEFGEE